MVKALCRLAVALLSTWRALAGFSSTDLLLPAAGRVEGSGGSQFYTTLFLTNPSVDTAAEVRLEFLLAGQENRAPAAHALTLPERSTSRGSTRRIRMIPSRRPSSLGSPASIC